MKYAFYFLLSISLLAGCSKGGDGGTTTTTTKTRIEEYLNGDTLLLDTLLKFKEVSNSILLADEKLRKNLDNAIAFRELLNKGDFEKLVEEKEIEFRGIFSGKLRRYFSLKNLFDLFFHIFERIQFSQ